MEEIIVLNFKSTVLLLMHLGIDDEFKNEIDSIHLAFDDGDIKNAMLYMTLLNEMVINRLEFKKPESKIIDYDAIQQEIDNNLLDLKYGVKDCYEFMHEMTIKYIEPVKPECMDLEQENPYADMLVAMLEINKIELY